jgi:hypothetical protein
MFFTLNPTKYAANLSILADCFQKNILVLRRPDMAGLSPDNLSVLRRKVQTSIQENPVELVVIDITIDPEKIENPEAMVTIGQLHRDLSTLMETVIVTEDFSYYYQPADGIVFFPYGLWTPSTKSIHLYYPYQKTVYDTTIEKTQPIMCFNRNLTWHRLYLFSLLVSKNWFNKIKYSFILELGNRLDSFYGIKQHLNTHEIEEIRCHGHLLPIRVEEEKTIPIIPVMFNDPIHTKNAINLVTETSLTEGVILTEKTAKPFMAYQIPILIASPGSTQFLEDSQLAEN